MDNYKAKQLWKIREITEIYPLEVSAEEVFKDDNHKKLNSFYSKVEVNKDGEPIKHYYNIDTYSDSDLENAKFEIEIEKLRTLKSIKNWITFWSVFSICAAFIALLICIF